MKSLKNLFVALIAIFIVSVNTNAADNYTLGVSEKDAKTLTISLSNVKESDFLKIKDIQGNSIFAKNLKAATSYSKALSMRSFTNGVYFVELETAMVIKVTPVIKNNTGIDLIEDAARIILKPRYAQEGKIITTSIVNLEERPVDIAIYDVNGRIINSEYEVVDSVIKRSYDFSNLKENKFTIAVKQNGREYNQEIDLN